MNEIRSSIKKAGGWPSFPPSLPVRGGECSSETTEFLPPYNLERHRNFLFFFHDFRLRLGVLGEQEATTSAHCMAIRIYNGTAI